MSNLLVPRSDVGEFRKRYKWMALFVTVALLTVVCTGLFSEGIPVALCWPTNLATLTLTAVLPLPNKS